jgi:sulfite reductase beta subunit-like hemoprotein
MDRALALSPPQGWSSGVRPEREPGRANITARVPRGDLHADQLEEIARLAPGGLLRLSREQNIVIGSVPTEAVPTVVAGLSAFGLGPDGVRGTVDLAACPGLTFCSLALTGSQEVARAIEGALDRRADLPRHVSIAVSGCPNSCAKQQVADIGLTGTKLRLGGQTELGYHLLLGADLAHGLVGAPVLKLLEREVPDAVVAVLESWATLRRPSESMASTFRRIGLERIGNALALRLRPEVDRLVAPEDAQT